MWLTKKVTQVSIVVTLVAVFVSMVFIALAAVHYVMVWRSGSDRGMPLLLGIALYGSVTVVCLSALLATLAGTLYLLAKRRIKQRSR